MNIHNFKLAGLIASLMLVSSVAQARDSRSSTRSSSDTIVSHSSQAEASGGSPRFGVGYSTLPSVGGITGSPVVMLQLNDRNLIQFHLFFPTTRPFSIMGGPYYKYSIAEKNGAGFHIGAGVTAGSLGSSFALQGQFVAGIHFAIPGTNNDVVMHFDGGPTIQVAGGGTADFYFGANSALLGASIAYMF